MTHWQSEWIYIDGSSRIQIPMGSPGPEGSSGPIGATGATGTTGTDGNQGVYGLGITHSYFDGDGNWVIVQGIDLLTSDGVINYNAIGITLETDHTGVLPETKFTITGVRGITGGSSGVTLPNEYYDIRNTTDASKDYPMAGFFKFRDGKTAHFKNIVVKGNAIKIEEGLKELQILGATAEPFSGGGITGSLLYIKELDGALRGFNAPNTIWGITGNDIVFARIYENRELTTDIFPIPSHGEKRTNYNYNVSLGKSIDLSTNLPTENQVKAITNDDATGTQHSNYIPVYNVKQYSEQSTNFYEAFPHVYLGLSASSGIEEHIAVLNEPSFYDLRDDGDSIYRKIEIGSCCFCKTDIPTTFPNDPIDPIVVSNKVVQDCIDSVSKSYCDSVGGKFDTISCLYRTDDDGTLNPYCSDGGVCCVNGQCVKSNKHLCESVFGGFFFFKEESGEYWTCERVEEEFGGCPDVCSGSGVCCLPGGLCIVLNCFACGLIADSICLEGVLSCEDADCCSQPNNFGSCCVDELCFDGLTPSQCMKDVADANGNPGKFNGIGSRCIVSTNQPDGRCNWILGTPFEGQLGCYFEINPATGETLEVGLYQREINNEWITYSCCSDNQIINYTPIIGSCCLGSECIETVDFNVCEELDGIFLGENVSCDNSPCGEDDDDDDDDTPLPEFTYGICCNCNEVTGYCTCMHETVPQGEVPPCELDVAYDWTFYSAEDICGDGNVSDENPFCCLDPLSQPCPWCSEGQSICDNLHGGGGGTPLFGGGGARSITNSHLRRMIKDPANPFLTNRKKKKK